MSALTRTLRRRLIRAAVRLHSTPAELTDSPAVVIAPHPDDETFGCGGMIALRRQLGHRVAVVFLSDGEASHENCCQTPAERISEGRRRTAVEAGRTLGMSERDLYWLGLPDRRIPGPDAPCFGAAAQQISDILSAIGPRVLYLPYFFDSLPDQEAASQLAVRAWSLSGGTGEILYYPVWLWHNLPLRSLWKLFRGSSLRIDIGVGMDQKRQAMDLYLSDLNPTCGRPYCGNLTASFVRHFRFPYEVFIRP